MKHICGYKPVLAALSIIALFLFFSGSNHLFAEAPQPKETPQSKIKTQISKSLDPSGEAIIFDPKETDDLLEKIDLINNAYTYRRGGRRDPFAPLIKSRALMEREIFEQEGSWELVCDLSTDRKMPLSNFVLEGLEMKGVVWGDLGAKALIKAPDGKAYNVKSGDYIGTNCGKIIKITRQFMKIEERYRNQAGRIRIDYKYKMLKRLERPGAAGQGKGETARLEPGSPTESITVDIDAEENTLITHKGEVESLELGDLEILRRVKGVILGPGEFEAMLIGGAINIALPRTTRFMSQITLYIPSRKTGRAENYKIGLSTEFNTPGLSEIASLGQTARFSLREKTPVYLFFEDEDFNNSGVVSITLSRLITEEEVEAARQAALERREEVDGAKEIEGDSATK